MIVLRPISIDETDLGKHDISLSDLKTFYAQVIEFQYISYEELVSIDVVRKIRRILEDFKEVL